MRARTARARKSRTGAPGRPVRMGSVVAGGALPSAGVREPADARRRGQPERTRTGPSCACGDRGHVLARCCSGRIAQRVRSPCASLVRTCSAVYEARPCAGLGFSLWHPRATGSRPALPAQNISGTPCFIWECRRFLRQAIGGRRRRRNDRFYIGTELWRDRRATISRVGRRGLGEPVERTCCCGGAGLYGRSIRRCRAAALGMRQISLGFDHPDRKPGRVLSPKRVPKPKVCIPQTPLPFY